MLPENIYDGISISAAQTLNLGFTEYSGSKHKKDVDEKKNSKNPLGINNVFWTKTSELPDESLCFFVFENL